MSNVLVIAAHADDEVLGCGGTLARHCAEGDRVQVIYMTDGVASRGSTDTLEQERKTRKQAAAKACSILGIERIHQFCFPDNEMDTVSLLSLTQAIESVMEGFQPQIIYTHHAGDLNIDHRLTHQATMTACRPQPGGSVKRILSFEVVSSTEWNTSTPENAFIPQYFVDIADFRKTKHLALAAYDDEMRSFPHSRSHKSIEAKEISRGASVGISCAEAFVILRDIRKG